MPLHDVRFARVAFAATVLAACAPVHADERRDGGFPVTFEQCTEFVGVAPVDAGRARSLVPQVFTPVTGPDGKARIVVRVSDCRSVRVGSGRGQPGTVAHIGIMIVSPDGTATDPNTSINNYTVTYASNLESLVGRLRGAGVRAEFDANLAYEYTAGAPGDLYAAVTPERGTTWFVEGKASTPNFPTPFLANWWAAEKPGAVTRMATTIEPIAFDFTALVNFHTSRNGVVGWLIGGNRIDGADFAAILSVRGAFERGDMAVTVTR